MVIISSLQKKTHNLHFPHYKSSLIPRLAVTVQCAPPFTQIGHGSLLTSLSVVESRSFPLKKLNVIIYYLRGDLFMKQGKNEILGWIRFKLFSLK